jgi:hypothetical protein
MNLGCNRDESMTSAAGPIDAVPSWRSIRMRERS